MRVIIINVVAQYGSTGKIAQVLQKGYKEAGHHVTICYGRRFLHSINSTSFRFTLRVESFISAVIMRLLGLPNRGLFFSTRRLKKYLNTEKPDLVHILNLHGYYVNEFKVLDFLREKHIPAIYTMCDEYPYTGKCPFTYDCLKFQKHCKECPQKRSYPNSWFFDRSSKVFDIKRILYDRLDNVVFAGCRYVYERAKTSSLIGNKTIKCIGEPIDLDTYFYPKDASGLKKQLNIPENNIVLLTVAVLDRPRKGGLFFIDLCNRMRAIPGYSFVYVGYNTDRYENQTPSELIKIPYIESLELLSLYFSAADVFVSTTLADTVPNAIINALGCGTPVCAFDIGGVSSVNVSDEEILKLSPIYDIEKLKNNVLSMGKKTNNIIEKCRKSVYDEFSACSIMKQYLSLCDEIIKKQ